MRTASRCVFFLIALGGSNALHAQVSGFASSAYGHHSNPLYSFEDLSDQVYQGSIELGYAVERRSVRFETTYAGTLTLFNKLSARSYLDHKAGFRTYFHPWKESRPSPVDDGATEDTTGETTTKQPDSAGVYGHAGLTVGARHDKVELREYDSYALGVNGGARWGFTGQWYVRALAEGSYRRYPFTAELSNVSGILSLQAGNDDERGFGYGIRAAIGVRRFTEEALDTTRFEVLTTSSVPVKPGQGKGRGRGNSSSQQSVSKQVLVNAEARTATQFAAGGTGRYRWGTGGLEAELVYRYNLSSSARSLARSGGNASINEDIYNDFFSSEGPDARMTVRQALPGEVHVTIEISHQRKRFGSPALDLDGIQVVDKRTDLHSAIDLTLSRYINLSESLGLDIGLIGGAVRNQSNDDFNDFAAWTIGISIGIGF